MEPISRTYWRGGLALAASFFGYRKYRNRLLLNYNESNYWELSSGLVLIRDKTYDPTS